MENKEEQINSLTDIRTMMENSSRFTALSGLSGISAGIIAIIGCIIVSISLNIGIIEQAHGIMNYINPPLMASDKGTLQFLILIALVVFTLAAISAIYFAGSKAKSKDIKLMVSSGKKFIFTLSFFLLTGALFASILIFYGIYFLIVPALLIFYGLGIISVSKVSFNIIRNLGLIEIALGFILAFIPVYALLFFMLGFGVMHIIYGLIVYVNYDKN